MCDLRRTLYTEINAPHTRVRFDRRTQSFWADRVGNVRGHLRVDHLYTKRCGVALSSLCGAYIHRYRLYIGKGFLLKYFVFGFLGDRGLVATRRRSSWVCRVVWVDKENTCIWKACECLVLIDYYIQYSSRRRFNSCIILIFIPWRWSHASRICKRRAYDSGHKWSSYV